ncbi:PRC-barrel domain containing protein [Roseovarius spongiae]|uniref:PRC-barrel domain containing protein n=1 Tax=Roseovarius spongiae TaxID=2320272 RepID=A0A3A8B5X0_9RHOB|nr:PRC-barrel domain-containing protein [Roseovarius spongiae]RKF16015.1 PRC-barrel domain containing protein [Roseovarius spongiae]
MKRFLTTTAIVLAMGSAGFADTDGNMNWDTPVESSAGQFYGSELIGMRVYRSDQDFESGAAVEAGANENWDDIGEVNDIIISKDGNVDAVILGIGGFLGMGERDVAIRMDQIRVVRENDDQDDRFLVVKATRENLESIPEYERRAGVDDESMTNNQNNAQDDDAVTAEQNADQNNAQDDNVAMDDDNAAMNEESVANETTQANDNTVEPLAMNRPQVQREGYTEVPLEEADSLNTEDLTGTSVYGANDEDIGEVSELIVENGKITRAVIDVGGFLGLGEKPVAVDFSKLQVMRQGEDGSLVVYMDATEETLESQPEYEG